MAVYWPEEMKVGMMHDHMGIYTVTFQATNLSGYREKVTRVMYIEDGVNLDKLVKVLKKRYKNPEIVSVKNIHEI